MRSRKEQREEARRYNNDVFYEVWRHGGNTDRINDDRVDAARDNGDSAESAARREVAAQRPRREEPEQDDRPF